MADESLRTQMQANQVALSAPIGTAVEVDTALKNIGVIPVKGTATTLGFYTATPVAQAAAITAPTGGATIDTQARAAIDSILNAIGAAAGGVGITA